ncbi:hypothetical protein [Fictibacillus enclensis]|nr:hypothetical protein [Fictibacillus enclensis]WHY72877.1 hypothetical protein QNH15_02770 [Fictibacillus enclensis]
MYRLNPVTNQLEEESGLKESRKWIGDHNVCIKPGRDKNKNHWELSKYF